MIKKERNMKEEIKVGIDSKSIHKKAIFYRIYKYTRMKYINILNEIVAVQEILEYCNESDEDTRQQYLKELEQLQQEKKELFDEIEELSEIEDREM